MPEKLDDKTRAFVDGKNFPVVATVNADGSPHSSIVLIKRDVDDSLLFVTHAGRRTERNITRDPRVNLSVFDLANPITSIEIRGTAKVLEGGGKELADELTLKYLDEVHDVDDVSRVVVRVVPHQVIAFPPEPK
ncbi:TIGR03618 family F420-dependent PPOX class oxidoreductase [Amycolatopsis sp. cmx-4-83]|uniref:TIGR03618 family F420-dependent PPOX class oxidoreductase n=1 Tax=Amycolatopsis sp. cmx-4-83 TaxID=2790940 RepID=UPI00397A50B3